MRRRRLIGGATVAAGLALAACGRRRGTALTKPASAGAAGTPLSGGTFTASTLNDPFDWDMSYQGRGVPNNFGQALAYNTLLSFKYGPDVKYEDRILQPALAERWETPDAQTYTFHVRKGVKFANQAPLSGRELTSADIKWTYEYWSRTDQFKDKGLPASQYAWFFEGMTGIETPDPYTAVLRFSQPFVPFINYAGSYWNPIVPHEIFDQDGSLKNRIVGTGPYQLDSTASQKGSRWVWKKRPDYWESGKPYIDQINWLILPDDATTAAGFQTKQLDILGGMGGTIDYNSGQQIKASNPNAVMYEYVPFGPILFIYINNRVAPLNDARVRQAMQLAINPVEFIKSFAGGHGELTLAGAFPNTFTQDEVRQILKYDPAQAKQLLSAAGYSSGLDLEFIYPAAYGQVYISGIQLVQAQLSQIGINITLKSADNNAVNTARTSGKYQLTATPRTTALVGDEDSYVYANFRTGSVSNQSFVSDPKLDTLLDAQRREFDATKRKDLIRQAVKLIVDQAYSIAIYRAAAYQFWQPHLKGYNPNFGSISVPQVDSWLEK